MAGCNDTLSANGAGYQTSGITADNLPVFADALKQRLTFPMGWSAHVTDLPEWKKKARAKLWELTLQNPDQTDFNAEIIDEVDRGTYVAKKIAFNLTRDSRVLALLLVPKGDGPFPAAVVYHDHGSTFDIGKEKLIETWGNDARSQSSQAWAERFFSGRFVGDELARRGYVVLAADALGWGDRGPLIYDGQQALAANVANLGLSLAGLMALEDTRAAGFLASIRRVDTSRIASVGFSMGAFRAWQAAALTDTIKATIAVNWMGTAGGLMVPGNNQLRGGSAWHMTHPGLMQHLDYPDVASLSAPNPMLMFAGEEDRLFPVPSVNDAFDKMKNVWAAWNAADRFESKFWPCGHVFETEQQDYAFGWLDGRFGR
ncbi:dienelactone hydrolase family protein [Agrobacterium sp. rho-13.3]|uniref:dienelactone hydrolase family protein n=1 Tax=Agrobacterium sp. rho-13.3 TaxID=3072980 RepID=UPI002A176C81|nr:alpha/beta hydrolase family protein [Agrobacterium sp. rho-13.3]MDX8310750.1 alpha/beta fold hydrolase [Agrobacterium sp. rho-13.3]